jgi:hypothetical protein
MKVASHKSRAVVWTVSAIVVLMLYVASYGPVVAMFRNRMIGFDPDGDLVVTLYAPLAWVYDHTPLRGPMESYFQWCDKVVPTPSIDI